MLSELVLNVSVLEDNTFTFPKVNISLNGVTVRKYKIFDQKQILNLSEISKNTA